MSFVRIRTVLSHPDRYELRASPFVYRLLSNILIAAGTAFYAVTVLYLAVHKNMGWTGPSLTPPLPELVAWGLPRLLMVFVPLAVVSSIPRKFAQGWVLSLTVCTLITLGISVALFYQASTEPSGDFVGFGQFLAVASLVGTLPGAGFFIWLSTLASEYKPRFNTSGGLFSCVEVAR